MSELTTVARPYAKAAFEYAQQGKKLAEWANMLALFAQILQDSNASEFLMNPIVSRADKVTFLKGFNANGEEASNQAVTNFLRLLAEYNRLAILPEISNLYHDYRAEFEKTMSVTVSSAKAMDDKQKSALTAALSQRLNRDVTLNVTIDETLLGGAIIRAGDFVIDGSVKGKLEKLAAQVAI